VQAVPVSTKNIASGAARSLSLAAKNSGRIGLITESLLRVVLQKLMEVLGFVRCLLRNCRLSKYHGHFAVGVVFCETTTTEFDLQMVAQE
jgi:RNase P/RNase MRP subunit p30